MKPPIPGDERLAGSGGPELRSAAYFLTGHGMAALIVAGFLMVILGVIVTGETWRSWLYRNTLTLADTCVAAADHAGHGRVTSPSAIRIPHRGQVPAINGPAAPTFHLSYNCTIPAGSDIKDIAYAHFGWLAGDQVTVRVDGRVVMAYSGARKVALPVRGGETLRFDVEHATSRADSAGFVGIQVPVLATGPQANELLFSVELLVNQVKSLTYLIPILSLGLVLALAWFGRLRSRIITMAMYVLVWAALHRALGVATSMGGLDAVTGTALQTVARIMFMAAVVYFHMEAARIRPKLIYRLARYTAAAGLLMTLLLLALPSPIALTRIYLVSHGLLALGSFVVAAAAAKRGNAMAWVIAAVSAITGVIFTALVSTRLLGAETAAPAILQIVMPMYVALFLQINLTLSEGRFRSERRQTIKLTEQVDLETARVSTLARFLPKSLVDRFSDRESIEANLTRVLTPRQVKVAVFQADLRGFSRLVAGHQSSEVIRILQACFGPVVDKAQRFAMVKLIGDCLWAFVEEEGGVGGGAPVRKALTIAADLAANTARVNRELQTAGIAASVRFGMAITYGQAVVGNLSSDSCIDYTALGDVVNLAARMEELTKSEEITAQIGTDGVLLSDAAREALTLDLRDQARPVDLGTRSIRSFESQRRVWYLSAGTVTGSADEGRASDKLAAA